MRTNCACWCKRRIARLSRFAQGSTHGPVTNFRRGDLASNRLMGHDTARNQRQCYGTSTLFSLPHGQVSELSNQRGTEASNAVEIHIQLVFSSKLAGLASVRPHRGEFAEIVLEPRRRDNLDNFTRRIASVPKGMPLAPRLEQPCAAVITVSPSNAPKTPVNT